MPICECCNVSVICCGPKASIPEVAALMRKHHVGDVIVVRGAGSQRVPLGIVTDRDIVVETVAPQIELELLMAEDIMSAPLVTVDEHEGFAEALRVMRQHKIRRLPVVTHEGYLCGIVTADDIIKILTAELSMVTQTITQQPISERQIRP